MYDEMPEKTCFMNKRSELGSMKNNTALSLFCCFPCIYYFLCCRCKYTSGS